MLNLIHQYPRSFGAAVVLHLIFAIIFLVNFEIDKKVIVEPEVDIVQATAINEEQVLAELAKLKAMEAAKRKLDDDRIKKLNNEAAKAKRKRQKEQKRLKELERKRKLEQKKKKKLEKERKIAERKKKEADKSRKHAEKKKKEADKQRKIAEQKRKEAVKNRKQAEKASAEARERRAWELKQRKKAEKERKHAEAEKRRAQEIEHKAKDRALKAIEQQQRLEDAKARRAELDAEQKRLAASHNKKADKIIARYTQLIKQDVKNNWRMPNFKPGSRCDVSVRLMPTGDVLQVEAKNCTGGRIFKRSVEDAVRAAAPLPLPPDKSLFPQFREIKFNFNPK